MDSKSPVRHCTSRSQENITAEDESVSGKKIKSYILRKEGVLKEGGNFITKINAGALKGTALIKDPRHSPGFVFTETNHKTTALSAVWTVL